jgi:GT2 family glycosyltransferase
MDYYKRIKKTVQSILKPQISQRKIKYFIDGLDKTKLSTVQCPQNPTIAVIVPCFGHEPYIEEMFASIINQTRRADQVIFIVDKSPDKSSDLLSGITKDLDTDFRQIIRIIKNDINAGQSASINRGVEAAETDLILILNDDDYLMHDCIDTILHIFKRFPAAVMVGGTSLHFSGESLKKMAKCISDITEENTISIDVRTPVDVKRYVKYNDLNMTHSGCCFLKSAWKSVGGYYSDKSKRIARYSDRDFQIRINALFPVALSNITPLSFWRNDSSVDSGINS